MLAKKNYFGNFLFPMITFLFFLCDISIQLLFNHQSTHSTLILFVCALFLRKNMPILFFITLLLCAESLFFTGASWLPLLYLPILVVGTHSTQHNFDADKALPFLILSCGIGLSYLSSYFYTGYNPGFIYTMSHLCVNLILMGIVSLKLNILGVSDNRA